MFNFKTIIFTVLFYEGLGKGLNLVKKINHYVLFFESAF